MINMIPTEAWEYSLIDAIMAALTSLKSPREIHRINLDGIGTCIPVRSGRIGILVALKSLNLKPDANVGVPLYCCPVVFKAIKMAGYRPVFIDVNKEDYCLSLNDLASKEPLLDALIAVHMFGQPCKMDKILSIMGTKPVIEDAAQSLGSYLEGKPTGTFGKISVFSFRSGKYLSAGEGGAIYCNDDSIIMRLNALNKEMPVPDVKSEFLHIIKTYLRTKLRSKPFWGIAGSTIWKYYNKKTAFINKSPIIFSQAFASDLSIVYKRINKLSRIIARQRSNASFYLKNLNLPPSMFCLETADSYYNRFMFPIKLESEEQYRMISDILLKNNISTSRPYFDVIEGAIRYYSYKGDCPQAEVLLRSTLIIPVHYKLKHQETEKITYVINKAWKSF